MGVELTDTQMGQLSFLLLLLPAVSFAFYGSNDKVVNLDSSNFEQKVVNSDELWLIEFYAPWCGHFKTLTPQWKSAADELDGVVNIGAVDADKHRDLGGKYGVKGFPTIKIFGANKNSPKDYKGGRDSTSIVEESFKQLRQMVKDKKNGGKSSGGSGGSSGGSGGRKASGDKDVVILTDANFDKLVMDSPEPFLIEFYAPWCGHCQRLEPEWNEAAAQLQEKTQGKVKIAKVDCTQNQGLAQRFGVQGFPTIKIFKGDKSTPEDYNAGRTASDVINEAMTLFEDVREPPELRQLTDQEIFDEKCQNAQLCLIFALPHILDDQAALRNQRLEMIRGLTEKYKAKAWEWFWTEAVAQEQLEGLLGIGGFGYPAMAALNIRKQIRSTQAGSFDEAGISEFLRNLDVGRAGRNVQAFTELPPIALVEEWDGKDGELPVEEEYDLDDLDWDDEPEEDLGKDEL